MLGKKNNKINSNKLYEKNEVAIAKNLKIL
jgi:hypothetical protein